VTVDPLLLAMPLLVPLLTAALAFLARRSARLQRLVGLGGTSVHLGAALVLLGEASDGDILVLNVGGWPAPFGIVLVADVLAALMVTLTALTGFAVMAYSAVTIDTPRERFGYYPLTLVLLTGVSGAFLTGDLFNLYVWFEVLLIASFVLLALGGERPQMEGAIKYVALNLLSSLVFLAAVGLLYGLAGTLNMADLHVSLGESDSPGTVTTVAMLFLVSFGIKAGLFPLFFWLPSSYHTPPLAVTALFAGLLTKVGVYVLIRAFTLLFTHTPEFTNPVLLVISGLTMATGVLGAAAHSDMRRILSFHIVSQIGYMVMGLAIATPLALAGSVFFLAHNILVKTNLLLVAGAARELRGTYEIGRLGGLATTAPLLALLFLVSALSLAGIPPLSGFWGKLILLRAALEAGHAGIAAVALVVGALTFLSMMKIWSTAFLRAPPAGPPPPKGTPWGLLAPIGLLAALTLLVGLAAGPLLDLCMLAAAQLSDPAAYVAAVLEGAP
jgi:multicomponent Na+:H+ antiporter subunit D